MSPSQATRGEGKRFFAEGTPPRAFELVGARATPSGILVRSDGVAGALESG